MEPLIENLKSRNNERLATKLVPELKELNSEETLTDFSFTSLEQRSVTWSTHNSLKIVAGED